MNVDLKCFQNTIFKDSLDPSIKTQILVASRQTGKSFILRVLTLVWSSAPGSRICYITPDYRLANKFYMEVASLLHNMRGVKCTSTNLVIKFPNGSRVEFYSAGSGDRIRGNTYDYVIIDECAFIPEETPDGQNIFNDIILPTLDDARAKGAGRLVLCSTPHGQTGYFYEQYIKALRGERGYSLVVHPVTEDESRSKEWCEEKRAAVPANTWRQEYMCEFLAAGYSFFTDCYSGGFTNPDRYLEASSPLVVGIDGAVGGGDMCGVTIMDKACNVVQYNLDLPYPNKVQMALDVARILDPLMDRIGLVLVEDCNPKMFYQDIQQNVPTWFRSKVKPTTSWGSNVGKYTSCCDLNSMLSDMRFEASNKVCKVQLDNFVVLKVTSSKQLQLGNSSPNIHDDLVASLAHCCQAYREYFSKSRSLYVG